MKIYMYLPDETRKDAFAIADEEEHLILCTENDSNGWSRSIYNPAKDMKMLTVRYSGLFGDSFNFTDVTGNRGSYHVKRLGPVVKYHMLNGNWDMIYDSRNGTVEILRQKHLVARAVRDMDYELFFEVELKETSEIIFTVGGLLCVAREIDDARA